MCKYNTVVLCACVCVCVQIAGEFRLLNCYSSPLACHLFVRTKVDNIHTARTDVSETIVMLWKRLRPVRAERVCVCVHVWPVSFCAYEGKTEHGIKILPSSSRDKNLPPVLYGDKKTNRNIVYNNSLFHDNFRIDRYLGGRGSISITSQPPD